MRKITESVKLKSAVKTFTTSVIAFIAALAVTGVIIAVCGFNPFEVYAKVFAESFSSKSNIASFLTQATPLIFAGLSFSIGLRSGLVNTGVEGQLIAGAMVSALVGAYATFIPGKLHLIVCILLGAAAGGLVAVFTAWLKVKTGAAEVVTGIMLNNIINLTTLWLVNGPLKPPEASVGQTEKILESATLTRLVPKTQLTSAIFISFVAAIVLHIMLNKTVFGYKIRVTGINRRAGAVAGINASRVYLASAFIFGAIAGLGGTSLSLGVYRRFIDGLSEGIGFAGIPVAALAGYIPIAVPFAGILFGILKAGTMILSRSTNIPLEVVSIIQALVVVFVSAPSIVTSLGGDIKSAFKKLFKLPPEDKPSTSSEAGKPL